MITTCSWKNIETVSKDLGVYLEHTKYMWITVCLLLYMPAGRYHLRCGKDFKDELERMENLQVIKKIDEPTERVSSLVFVQKKSGAEFAWIQVT